MSANEIADKIARMAICLAVADAADENTLTANEVSRSQCDTYYRRR